MRAGAEAGSLPVSYKPGNALLVGALQSGRSMAGRPNSGHRAGNSAGLRRTAGWDLLLEARWRAADFREVWAASTSPEDCSLLCRSPIGVAQGSSSSLASGTARLGCERRWALQDQAPT